MCDVIFKRSRRQDLLDGFFPAEMQTDYPEGVIFLVEDRRFEIGNRVGLGRSPFSGIGRRLQSRPGSASQTCLPPISSQSPSSISSRPDSVSSFKMKKSTDPLKPKLLPNLMNKEISSSKKKLVKPKNNDSELKKYAPFKRTPMKGGPNVDPSSSNVDVCHLKIFGLGRDPFLLELVSYDTVKTLRGVISNILKSAKVEIFSPSPDFKLFTSFPRRAIDDDSMTLGDLNFLPNGVIHVNRIL